MSEEDGFIAGVMNLNVQCIDVAMPPEFPALCISRYKFALKLLPMFTFLRRAIVQRNIIEGCSTSAATACAVKSDRPCVQAISFHQPRAATAAVAVYGVVIVDIAQVAVLDAHLQHGFASCLQALDWRAIHMCVFVIGMETNEMKRGGIA